MVGKDGGQLWTGFRPLDLLLCRHQFSLDQVRQEWRWGTKDQLLFCCVAVATEVGTCHVWGCPKPGSGDLEHQDFMVTTIPNAYLEVL